MTMHVLIPVCEDFKIRFLRVCPRYEVTNKLYNKTRGQMVILNAHLISGPSISTKHTNP